MKLFLAMIAAMFPGCVTQPTIHARTVIVTVDTSLIVKASPLP